VQYYLQHLIRPDAGQRNNPLPLAQGAGSGYDFLDEKAGQPENIEIRWPDRF
jgi:hypothetical protein